MPRDGCAFSLVDMVAWVANVNKDFNLKDLGDRIVVSPLNSDIPTAASFVRRRDVVVLLFR